MAIKVTKKNSEIAKGAGTAAREAVKDAKALEEQKAKELQEREAQVIKQNEQKPHKSFKPVSKIKNQYNQTDLIVLPTMNSVKLYPENELKEAVWRLSQNCVPAITFKQFNVRDTHFGWVAYGDKVIPSYDISVVERDGKFYAIPNSVENVVIPVEELKPVHLHHKQFGFAGTSDFTISEYLGWDGIYIVPGTGLQYASDTITYSVKDLSNIKLSRTVIDRGFPEIYMIYYFRNKDNDLVDISLPNLIGVSDIFGNGIEEAVEFSYDFTEGDIDPMNFNYLKEAIGGQTFYIPREMVSQAKAICNAIESDSVTLSQLKKLSHILKVKFTVVPEEYVSGTALIKLPKVHDNNKEIYQATDMTENEYKLLSEGGMEVPIGAYGFAELYAAFESGNYESKDVQYLVDLLRRYTALDENNK